MRKLITKNNLKAAFFRDSLARLATMCTANFFILFLANFVFDLLTPEGGTTTVQAVHIYAFAIGIIVLDICIIGAILYLKLQPEIETLKKSAEDSDADAVDSLRIVKEIVAGNFVKEQIYSFNHVMRVEQSLLPGDEVWMISSDVDADLNDPIVRETVLGNLEKGVIYRYIVTKVLKGAEGVYRSKAQEAIDILKGEGIYKKYYEKNLFVDQIDSYLIVPSVDLIIYNATSRDQREGYVCVELRESNNTFSYLKLTPDLNQFITEKIGYQSRVKGKNVHWVDRINQIREGIPSVLVYIYNALPILWGFLAIKKSVTLGNFGFVLGLVFLPAVIIFILSDWTADNLKDVLSKSAIKLSKNGESVRNIINLFEDSGVDIEGQIEEKKKKVLTDMDLKRATDLETNNYCDQEIWILSDLSCDFADENFVNWLSDLLDKNKNIICNIILPEDTASEGRFDLYVKNLIKKYPNNINGYLISDDKQLLWAKTYGVLLLKTGDSNTDIYVSIGSSDNAFFKKAQTTEENYAWLYGILKKYRSNAKPIQDV